MAEITYDRELTALLVIDPYNDFNSEGGKIRGLSPRGSSARGG